VPISPNTQVFQEPLVARVEIEVTEKVLDLRRLALVRVIRMRAGDGEDQATERGEPESDRVVFHISYVRKSTTTSLRTRPTPSSRLTPRPLSRQTSRVRLPSFPLT
jgi:hypothetical protein